MRGAVAAPRVRRAHHGVRTSRVLLVANSRMTAVRPGYGESSSTSQRERGSHLAQEALRVLQGFLDADEEGDGVLAVDDAVIVGERQVHDRPRHDLPALHHGAL